MLRRSNDGRHRTKTARAEGVQTRRSNHGFDLYLDARLSQFPDELHFDLRRFPRRVEAYWNGCAWVI